MVDRNLIGYSIGKFLAGVTLIDVGYILAKKYIQKPIAKNFPEKKIKNHVHNIL